MIGWRTDTTWTVNERRRTQRKNKNKINIIDNLPIWILLLLVVIVMSVCAWRCELWFTQSLVRWWHLICFSSFHRRAEKPKHAHQICWLICSFLYAHTSDIDTLMLFKYTMGIVWELSGIGYRWSFWNAHFRPTQTTTIIKIIGIELLLLQQTTESSSKKKMMEKIWIINLYYCVGNTQGWLWMDIYQYHHIIDTHNNIVEMTHANHFYLTIHINRCPLMSIVRSMLRHCHNNYTLPAQR